MKSGKKISSVLLCTLFAIFTFFGLFVPLAKADNVVQAFNSKTKLETGTVVRISSDSAGYVESAPANRADLIYGVVVEKTDAPIVLNKGDASTYVGGQGEYPVLVSAENGAIASGDYLSISTTKAGVAAKATGAQSVVLGKAVGTFSGSGTNKITVNLDITRNPGFRNTLAIPNFLQKIGNSIAGKEASPLRIYIALVLFLVSSVLSIVLLTVGTRGGLMAIGRNPLSKHSVLRALSQVITAALIIFITSLIGVYLLLRI